MRIERWCGTAAGRAATVARGNLVWTVSNARTLSAGFESQVAETLELLEAALSMAGSDKTQLLSVQVILSDIATREMFNEIWCTWIGDNSDHWPQRAVLGGSLAPGLLIEIIATAARLTDSGPTDV